MDKHFHYQNLQLVSLFAFNGLRKKMEKGVVNPCLDVPTDQVQANQ